MHGNKYKAIAVSAIFCVLFVLPVYGEEDEIIETITVTGSLIEHECAKDNVLCLTGTVPSPMSEAPPLMMDYTSGDYEPPARPAGVPAQCNDQWNAYQRARHPKAVGDFYQLLVNCLIDYQAAQIAQASAYMIAKGLEYLGISCSKPIMSHLQAQLVSVLPAAATAGACAVVSRKAGGKTGVQTAVGFTCGTSTWIVSYHVLQELGCVAG